MLKVQVTDDAPSIEAARAAAEAAERPTVEGVFEQIRWWESAIRRGERFVGRYLLGITWAE